MGEMRKSYKLLVGISDRGEVTLKGNIEMGLKELGCEGMKWIHSMYTAFLNDCRGFKAV
jgi:hypothetical protein